MTAIARWVRFWFGLQPFVIVSTMFFVVRATLETIQTGDLTPGEPGDVPWVGLTIVLLGMMSIAAVSAIAWYKLRKGKVSARPWAIAASLASLPVAGVGTLAGILGLVVFSRRNVVAQMDASLKKPEAPRIPGDGTSKFVDRFASGVQLVSYIAAGHFWNNWARAHGLVQSESVLEWVIPFAIALHLSILVHELGHVLGGWSSHMKLRHLVVGPCDWAVRGGHWEFSFHAGGLWGRGAAAMVPTRLKALRTQRIFTTLGGPLGSLFIGGVGALLALSAPGSPWEQWWEGCSFLATLGVTAFVFNLIPLRPEDQYSDGAHLFQLLARGPWADVHMAFSVVSSTLVTPLRPRDFNLSTLERASAFLTSGKQGLLLRVFQGMHHLDAGRDREALRAMDEAAAIYPSAAASLDADLHAEFVFVAALIRSDLDAARLWWQRLEAKGGSKFKVDYWKARAALLWLEGDPKGAEEAWQKGNAFAQAAPAAGAYDFDRWCYSKLREALDAPEVHSAVPPPLPEFACEVLQETSSHQTPQHEGSRPDATSRPLMPEVAMA